MAIPVTPSTKALKPSPAFLPSNAGATAAAGENPAVNPSAKSLLRVCPTPIALPNATPFTLSAIRANGALNRLPMPPVFGALILLSSFEIDLATSDPTREACFDSVASGLLTLARSVALLESSDFSRFSSCEIWLNAESIPNVCTRTLNGLASQVCCNWRTWASLASRCLFSFVSATSLTLTFTSSCLPISNAFSWRSRSLESRVSLTGMAATALICRSSRVQSD